MRKFRWASWAAAAMTTLVIAGCMSDTPESLLSAVGADGKDGVALSMAPAAPDEEGGLRGGNDNDNGAGNTNDNGTGNGNDNAGNTNDNGAGNTNDNGAGNTNDNGAGNGNDNAGNTNDNGGNTNDNGGGDLGACCFGDGTCELLTQRACAVPCPGDMDCSGSVDFNDIDLFVEALQYPGGIGWPYGCPWINGDLDGDGDVNFNDIDPFVAAIVEGRSCQRSVGGTWLGSGSSCSSCGSGNENGNDNGGNGNDNAGNTNDNGGNTNDNGGGNGNDNTGNSNDNGGGNGNDNAGNTNDNGGNTNDNSGGNGNDNAGNTNDNGGNTNDNGGGNGNDNAGNTNDNGGNTNDNGGGNGNDNAGNTNDNGGNTNDNSGGNGNDNTGNTNDNGGNTNDNGGNTNDNGGGDRCADGSLQLSASLSGSGGRTGDMEYREFSSDCKRFRVRVEDFPSNQTFDVHIEGVKVGSLKTDSRGRGELRYDTSDGNFPSGFPAVFAGDVGDVGNQASGVLGLDCSDNSNCNG